MFTLSMELTGSNAPTSGALTFDGSTLVLALAAPVLIAAGAALLAALLRSLEAHRRTVALHGPSPLPVAGASSGIA